MVQNQGLIFKSVPDGWPVEGKDLVIEVREFNLEVEPPQDGITTKNYYASFDPYQRGRMRPSEVKSYSPAYALNQPINNATVAKVLKSNNATFKPGDIVIGTLPTEEYSVVNAFLAKNLIKKIENPYKVDLKLFLGALGMPGLTAYSSFYKIGEPKKGETIFISAASGAVGQIVGQLAKHEGLTVIGSVGSDEKLDFITKELNFDGGFNYKKEKASGALERLAPKGVDIYFENVGGDQLDAALAAMNDFGRIIACGMISQYNVATPDERYGVKNTYLVITKRLKFQGFIVTDPGMGSDYEADQQKNMGKWISEGTFTAKQSVTVGMDNAIKGLVGMLKGENFGKAVLQIDELNASASRETLENDSKL